MASSRFANNSSINFYEVASRGIEDYFFIEVRWVLAAEIEGAAGQTTSAWGGIDLNNDGLPDVYRLIQATIRISDQINVSAYMTGVTAHEIGHTMLSLIATPALWTQLS